jgi:hypothetical protein
MNDREEFITHAALNAIGGVGGAPSVAAEQAHQRATHLADRLGITDEPKETIEASTGFRAELKAELKAELLAELTAKLDAMLAAPPPDPKASAKK